jgi:hypothetical protein
MRRGPKPLSNAEKEARERFREEVLSTFRCFLKGVDGNCEGPSDAHHVIRAQLLRTHALTLTNEEKIALVWDPRNGVAVCRRHHDLIHGLNPRGVFREEVPESVERFARDNGLEHILDRECPSIHSVSAE